jgi:hypothetical protein
MEVVDPVEAGSVDGSGRFYVRGMTARYQLQDISLHQNASRVLARVAGWTKMQTESSQVNIRRGSLTLWHRNSVIYHETEDFN